MSFVKLSACAIMKNEAKHVGRWLDCVRQVADEIIVVDTGSADDTAALAEAGGARVVHFKWADDFAAAKNFAINQAHGNWILFLDADEYFPPEYLGKVRPLLEKLAPNPKVGAVLCRWVNFDEDQGMLMQGADVQIRLFRNLRSLRYQGNVHEAIYVPPRFNVIVTDEIEIHHTGYSSSVAREKALRNQRLLRQRVRAAGRVPSLEEQRYLLDCAYTLQDMPEACRLSECIVSSPERHSKLQPYVLAGMHRIRLSALMADGRSQAEIEAAAGQAREDFPELADFPFILGSYYVSRGLMDEGRKELQRGFALYERNKRQRAEGDLNALSGNAEAMLNQARQCLQAAGHPELRISACAIMKDEAENLPAWLESVRSFADEIIVVDTGSHDATKVIAAEGGARVLDFAWCDDFGAAKNFALEQATGNWIAFPDADETFSEEACRKIRPLLERLGEDVRGVVCPRVNIDKDDRNRYMSTTLQIRLFRNLPDVRYLGRIHEALTGLPDSSLYHTDELLIYHTGYSKSVDQQKLERNLAMLRQKAAAEGKVVPEDYHYYMDCYYGMADYREAAKWAKMVIDDPGQGQERWEDAWETYLSALVRGGAPEEETLAAMEKGRAECPEMPRFTLMQGLYLYQLHDYLRAEELLLQGLKEPVRDEIANIRRLQPHALAALADMALLQGRAETARAYCLQALQANRYLPDCVRLLVQALRAEQADDVSVIEVLSRIYAGDDAGFLYGALQTLGGTLSLYYARRAGVSMEPAEAYGKAGRFDAALEVLHRRLDIVEKMGIVQSETEFPGQAANQPLWGLLGERYREAWRAWADGTAPGRGKDDELPEVLGRLQRSRSGGM